MCRESRCHNYGPSSRCGCGCGCCCCCRGKCGCGHEEAHPSHGHHHSHAGCCQETPAQPEPCTCKPKFVRRFRSPEEELEELEEYKKELSREISGVERRLKELRAQAGG